ncbi:uncharacterized protein A1O9_06294, partial [Exophiala aquamarina CBS 119918]
LFNIRHGPGAATFLPHPAPQVTQLDIWIPEQKKAFSPGTRDQVYGAWEFVRHNLPRIKYHNPSVPIRVQSADSPSLSLTFESENQASLRSLDQKGSGDKPKSAIFKTSWSIVESIPQPLQDGSSSAPPEPIFRRQVKVDLSEKEAKHIWKHIEFITKCEEAPEPTEEEKTMMQKLNNFKSQSEKDRRLVKAGMDKIFKEKEELRKAREAAERLTSE